MLSCSACANSAIHTTECGRGLAPDEHGYLHNFGSTLNARQIGLLWRAGLSRVGLRSSPSQEKRGVSDTL
ncbi:hypothetical protein C1Y26_17810 [Pseudomonas sp. MPR-R2A7]|nr:hypothetical protein C1Y23_11195 [Pseudomonas sp. GW460-12]PMX34009.1 hypothetical protein C1Y24_15155 [Pseudomonas sp. MPR-R2A4]PMX39674.1 hypothetical protein C1Y26_17810 [Pseudomonas sp. MPR-R2A7]PMX53509.1 hypothetical protein C1Y17_13060 [Pseudomonas sp. MPR-R2A6]PMX88682.1 hypothetical protein C1Y21_20545 [Pseudomonas sp. MPR-R2A3]PMY15277.1 hypothetical protein C1Y22_06010 [Pseudomonas sp. MPR-R2A5]PNA33481.1 hypothetical protein C1Y16_18290 [Pseudomonas sp. MPR-ANB1]PNA50561.1 hyp